VLFAQQGVGAVPYHAGMDPQQRRATEENFRDGRARVVVATVAFGMGIDVSSVKQKLKKTKTFVLISFL
jgi:ATP-dependent DNA helicase RecQ